MNEATIIGLLGQVSTEELREDLEKATRGVVRDLFLRVLEAEVTELCGPAYERGTGRECYRAGSAPGGVALMEKREEDHPTSGEASGRRWRQQEGEVEHLRGRQGRGESSRGNRDGAVGGREHAGARTPGRRVTARA